MITGSSSVDSVLPGNPSTISNALETVGAGIGHSRSVTNAWQTMSLAAWHGQAASRWESFVPRESARTGKAPVAFNRAATAMLRYQNAFASARAEIEAAIEDAANADRATATAKQTHADAIRIAQAAQAGSPGSVVPAFSDPGATRLAAAQSRAQTALTRFTQIGDEVAAEIRAAASETSGEKPGIEWWDQVVQFPGRFVEGVILQGVDSLVGVWDMLPIKYVFDDWFGDGKPWWEAYFVDLWGGIIGAVVEDPWGAVESMWGDFIAADHWDGYAGEGTGRVTANVLMMLLGGAGAVRLLKGLKRSKGPGAADAVTGLRATEALENIPGVSVADGRVLVGGVPKMSTDEWASTYASSVHNGTAPESMLGKYVDGGPESYVAQAADGGYRYFSLGGNWSKIAKKYELDDQQMFDLFNRPFLDEAVARGQTIHFTHDPESWGGALWKELEYLESEGYMYDPETMTAILWRDK